ncbi:hypothetical protein JWH05_04800, partial [Xanthomonas melonis]|nr:hypothetical protein [Xanthomonas melonis]
ACLVAGGAGAFLNVLKHRVARKHGSWCLRGVFQGRLSTYAGATANEHPTLVLGHPSWGAPA